ncbi:GntR family transcriptional regulator [Paenibacillus piri]|uniref:GntR family transcriptional regulator n=1 Tax=Paenibacillus piri TaxID=2547395 RepID=A0A4R5KUQ6_9BACL|nr:GntR family transcriptional regulator [Paenibacillus piri]TDF98677.1 GntR family transcriptional regulator [Paenibacillus piri]
MASHSLDQSMDTLDRAVYVKLKEMIMNKSFKSGELLIQNQLSDQLGVSRTPLRKAMAELEMEGLLERMPKGWLVKEFSIEDMISVFEIRAALEGLACRLVAGKIGKADLAYLRAMFEQAKPSEQNMMHEYYEADVKFHNIIVQSTKDSLLIRTIKSCRIIQTSHQQGLYLHPNDTYQEHMDIIDALEEGDGHQAESLMRAHIQKAIVKLKSGNFEVYR